MVARWLVARRPGGEVTVIRKAQLQFPHSHLRIFKKKNDREITIYVLSILFLELDIK